MLRITTLTLKPYYGFEECDLSFEIITMKVLEMFRAERKLNIGQNQSSRWKIWKCLIKIVE